MRWKNLRKSGNVERRRGGGKKAAMGGGLGAIVMALVAIFIFKEDPQKALSQLGQGQSQQGEARPPTAAEKEMEEFVDRVLGSTEDVWTRLFRENGGRNGFPTSYRMPTLIDYDGSTPMKGGGIADSRMGPFYRPDIERVFLDTAFFKQMVKELGGGGKGAYAYVIAHEVGHHIQKLTGKTTEVHRQKSRLAEAAYNRLSVRLELQADFYAGIWAHHANKSHRAKHGTNMLDPADIRSIMNAAEAIGDDSLQRKAGQRVQEEKFSHGTSEQRMNWFLRGIKTGDINEGDTFSPDYEDL